MQSEPPFDIKHFPLVRSSADDGPSGHIPLTEAEALELTGKTPEERLQWMFGRGLATEAGVALIERLLRDRKASGERRVCACGREMRPRSINVNGELRRVAVCKVSRGGCGNVEAL